MFGQQHLNVILTFRHGIVPSKLRCLRSFNRVCHDHVHTACRTRPESYRKRVASCVRESIACSVQLVSDRDELRCAISCHDTLLSHACCAMLCISCRFRAHGFRGTIGYLIEISVSSGSFSREHLPLALSAIRRIRRASGLLHTPDL